MVANVQVGSVIQDNDKRQDGRQFTITKINSTHAFYQGKTRIVKVRFDRIYTDGGVHADGWSRVSF